MQNRILRSATLALAVAAAAGGYATSARAQMGPGMGPGSNGMIDPAGLLKQGASMAPKGDKGSVAPPPALPGAASRADTVAPATRIPTDMSPNDALFDAINRGDVAAARDALSRGADLSAENVLGMTPMELSVDLGRNDISFLLLSYRGADSSHRPTVAANLPSASAPPGKAPAKTAGAHPPAHHAAGRAPVVPVKDVVPTAPRTPQLFANDGGAPVPNAGFLGFDAGRH